MRRRNLLYNWISQGGLAAFVLILSGCGVKAKSESSSTSPYCADPAVYGPGHGATGTGLVFNVDPMISANDAVLSPADTSIGDYASSVSLGRLTGYGLLSGAYVDVLNGLCGNSYGAYSASNRFSYSHSDQRFAEVMLYYYGDQYRAKLDSASSLLPVAPMAMIAKCDVEDNAYYSQGIDTSTGQTVDYICMGYASLYDAADFSDDSQVTIHELQHGTTAHAYSSGAAVDFNRFEYDEAGSMNEGISDFMALVHTKPLLLPGFDEKFFSRWALGSFFASSSARGAHRCPVYDSDYPTCGSYSNDPAVGFDVGSGTNHVSFAYPDGLGWPYQLYYSGPGYLRTTFNNFPSQQEIHNDATIISGTLYDIYEELLANHGNDHAFAQQVSIKLVINALAALPKPTATNKSPVTFRGFGAELQTVATALQASSVITAGDLTDIQTVLTDRGLINGTLLTAGWAAVGPGGGTAGAGGTPANVGVRYIDLQSAVGAADEKLEPGDIGVLWFNIENQQATTAGGLLIDAVITGSDIKFLGSAYNYGYISNSRAQLRYGKINGTSVVTSIGSVGIPAQEATYAVAAAGSTYFTTDPKYSSNLGVGFLIQAASSAVTGNKTITVSVKASNSSSTETLTYTLAVQ